MKKVLQKFASYCEKFTSYTVSWQSMQQIVYLNCFTKHRLDKTERRHDNHHQKNIYQIKQFATCRCQM